jgi:predicted DNA-binding protein YlxM (UPF0122 family)
MERDYSSVLEIIKNIQIRKQVVMQMIQNTTDVAQIEQYNQELAELDNLEKEQHIMVQNMNESNVGVIEMEKMFKNVISDNISDLDRDLAGLTLEDEGKVKKMRMMQIADYQAKQFAMRNRILFVLVIGLITIAVALTLLKQDIISNSIASMIMGLVITVVFIYGSYLAYDLNRRDNFDFDRYTQPDIAGSKTGTESVIEHDKRFFHDLIAALVHRMGIKTDTEKDNDDERKMSLIDTHIKGITRKHKNDVRVRLNETFTNGISNNGHPSLYQGNKLMRDHPMGNNVEGADGIMSHPMPL